MDCFTAELDANANRHATMKQAAKPKSHRVSLVDLPDAGGPPFKLPPLQSLPLLLLFLRLRHKSLQLHYDTLADRMHRSRCRMFVGVRVSVYHPNEHRGTEIIKYRLPPMLSLVIRPHVRLLHVLFCTNCTHAEQRLHRPRTKSALGPRAARMLLHTKPTCTHLPSWNPQA